jgi:hypothetical protein
MLLKKTSRAFQMIFRKLERKLYRILYKICDTTSHNTAIFSAEFRVLEPRIRLMGNVGSALLCLARKYAPEGKQKIHLGLGRA